MKHSSLCANQLFVSQTVKTESDRKSAMQKMHSRGTENQITAEVGDNRRCYDPAASPTNVRRPAHVAARHTVGPRQVGRSQCHARSFEPPQDASGRLA